MFSEFLLILCFIYFLSISAQISNIGSKTVKCFVQKTKSYVQCSDSVGCDPYANGCAKSAMVEGAIWISEEYEPSEDGVIRPGKDFMIHEYNMVNNPAYPIIVTKHRAIVRNGVERKLNNLFFKRCEKLLNENINIEFMPSEDIYEEILRNEFILGSNHKCYSVFQYLIIELSEPKDIAKEHAMRTNYQKLLGFNVDLVSTRQDKYLIEKRVQAYDHYFKYWNKTFIRNRGTLIKNYDSDSEKKYDFPFYKYVILSNINVNALDISGIPDSFSYVDIMVMIPPVITIRDQSMCGSCYAFGTLTAMNTRKLVYHFFNIKKEPLETFLSVWDVITCGKSIYHSLLGGCDGGYPSAVYSYLFNYGVVTGGPYFNYFIDSKACKAYPLFPTSSSDSNQHDISKKPMDCKHSCFSKKYAVSYNKDKYFSKSYGLTLQNLERRSLNDIFKYGPVSRTIDVTNALQFWPWFLFPVYIYQDAYTVSNHEVYIDGYGFNKTQKLPYYEVVNSWGSLWGILGRFLVIRDTLESDLAYVALLNKYHQFGMVSDGYV